MKKRNLFLIIFFAILVSFILSTWGLTESSEARYAQISKEMYTSGDYLHPTYLGIHHYHKPPVTYYITALGYFIFGVNETGARFFLMLALLTQLWLVYKITLLFYKDQHTALAALLIYFSYPIVQAAAKNLTTDAYLTSFIFGSAYCFMCYRQKQRLIFLYLFYIICGLAFLTKGPVGLLPQGLFAIGYSRIGPSRKSAGFHHYTAFLTGLLVCFSWFALLIISNPGMLSYFIKYQLIDRVASDAFNRAKPWWYYLVTMPILGLPAFVYFFDYLRSRISSVKNINSPGSNLLLISLGIAFLVFSASSSKLSLYVLPLYLFISMISASHLKNMTGPARKIGENFSFWFSFIFFLALAIGCFISLPVVIPTLPVLSAAFSGLICTVIIYLEIWPSGSIKGPLLNATFMIVLIIAAPFVMKKNELKINSVKPLAAFIGEHSTGKANGSIAVYDYLLPSLAFYTDKNIITIDNGNSGTHRETQFENNDKKWQSNYVKVTGNGNGNRLPLFATGSNNFLVARKNNDLPDSLAYMKLGLQHRTMLDKWVIYY